MGVDPHADLRRTGSGPAASAVASQAGLAPAPGEPAARLSQAEGRSAHGAETVGLPRETVALPDGDGVTAAAVPAVMPPAPAVPTPVPSVAPTGLAAVPPQSFPVPPVRRAAPTSEQRVRRVVAAAAAGRPGVVLVEGEAGCGKSWLAARVPAFPEVRAAVWRLISFRTEGPPIIRTSDHALARTDRLVRVDPLGRADAARPDQSGRTDAGRVDRAGLGGVPGRTDAGRADRGFRGEYPGAGGLRADPRGPGGGEHAAARDDGGAGRESAGRGREDAVWAALRDDLAALAYCGRPVVLVAEDVHLAGDTGRALLRGLLERPPPAFAAVLTYRPEELALPGLPLGRAIAYPPEATATRVRLGPLDTAQVRTLATAALGEFSCPAEFTDRLTARSGGVAQVVADLLHGFAGSDGRERWTAQDVDDAPVPPRLAELVLGRMAGLAADERRVVWAAAVLGEPADAAELAAVAGLAPEPGAAALVAALSAAVLHEFPDSRYGFRVPLAEGAVREVVPGPTRELLHRGAAEALARREPVPWARLARHQRRSGQIGAALGSVEKAAEQAIDASDSAAAVALLQDALAWPAAPADTRARLALLLAHRAVFGLRTDQTVAVLRRAVADADLPLPVRGEMRLDLALLLGNQMGRNTEAAAQHERAAEELAQDRPALAARAMSCLALPVFPGLTYDQNMLWMDRAESAAAAAHDPAVSMAVRVNRAAVLLCSGDPEGWRMLDALPRDGDLGSRRQVARGLCNGADVAVWLGEYQRAAGYLATGLEMAEQCGAAFIEQTAAGTSLRMDWATGRWSGLGERARQFITDIGGLPTLSDDAQLILGLLSLARGEWAAVHGLLDSPQRPDASIPIVAAAGGARIRLLLARGDDLAAAAVAEQVWARLRAKGLWTWATEVAPWAVTALTQTGADATAASFIEEFAAGLHGGRAPSAQAALLWCGAVLGEAAGERAASAAGYRAAAQAYRTAADAYRALPRPYEAALTTEAAGRCAAAATAADPGDGAAAHAGGEDELRWAERRFEDLGATWDAARVRTALRAVRPQERPERRPPGRRPYGEQLSPREREVAELAAAGQSNRDIAATLHLSPRTVEQHVARALRKLRARSRHELARVLADVPGPSSTGAGGGVAGGSIGGRSGDDGARM